MTQILGYKIFNNLDDFYAWQGYNGDPAPDTVNYIMGFGTKSPFTTRYTYPYPHPSASYNVNTYGLPETVTGPDQRICAIIDSTCPPSKVPSNLQTLEEVQAEGWFVSDDE